MWDSDQISEDFIFDGRLVIHQRRKGYRFSVDAPLLIWFASSDGYAPSCLDIGAGSGIVGLGLLATGVAQSVVALELQSSLHELSVINAEANNLEHCYEPICGDLADASQSLSGKRFDLIVSNPPYWPAHNGRLPQDMERRIAGHEINGTIDSWVQQMAGLLKNKRSRISMIFPARRFDELLVALARAGLSTTRLIPVQPSKQVGAELILVEASAVASGHLQWETPLILKDAEGSDSVASQHILSGEFNSTLAALPDRRPEYKSLVRHPNPCSLSSRTLD